MIISLGVSYGIIKTKIAGLEQRVDRIDSDLSEHEEAHSKFKDQVHSLMHEVSKEFVSQDSFNIIVGQIHNNISEIRRGQEEILRLLTKE